MSREKVKRPEYGTELKLAAVRRVLAGESVREVADELGVRRKRLYVWKDRYAELGEAGLVRKRGGRPRKDVPSSESGVETKTGRGELLAARNRIGRGCRRVFKVISAAFPYQKKQRRVLGSEMAYIEVEESDPSYCCTAIPPRRISGVTCCRTCSNEVAASLPT